MQAKKRSHPVDILLIEDNPADVGIAQEGLQLAEVNGRLHVAADGMHALQFLRKQGEHTDAPRPDLILLDLNMPRMGGLEFLEVVKQDPALRSIPVVVLTSSRAEGDVVRAYHLHANSYLIKPIGLDAVVETFKAIQHFWAGVAVLPPRNV